MSESDAPTPLHMAPARPYCGVLAIGHGRVPVPLVDAPAMGRPVRLL